jgi:predicted dehydrogenase
MTRLRTAVFGGGLIAQIEHVPNLLLLREKFEVVRLADPSATARNFIEERFGILTCETLDQLLDDPLDAIVICSPDFTHKEAVLAGLARGLPVFCEKPLCYGVAEADEIIAARDKAGKVVQVGYMKRFDPAYEALVPPAGPLLVTTATVDPGIGDTYRPAEATDVVPAGAETREQVAAALGDDDPRHVRPFSDAFLGALVHDVNLVLGLLDEPVEVTDAAAAPDGSLAYGAFALQDGGRWTAAWMLLPGADAFREELRLYGAEGVRTLTFAAPYDRPGSDSYVRQLAHFHDCITDGNPCRTPAAQGARDVALLTELYQAAIA